MPVLLRGAASTCTGPTGGEPAATAVGFFSERRFSTSNRVRFPSTLKLIEPRVCKGAEYYTHATVPVPSSAYFKPSVNRVRTPCG